MDLYRTVGAAIIGLGVFMTFATACDKAKEQKQAPPPKIEQPAPPPPKPMAENPFIHEPPKPPPAPAAPLGNQTLQPRMRFIGTAKMNDCYAVNLWRDDANHVTCYFSDCESIHLLSCVRDEK